MKSKLYALAAAAFLGLNANAQELANGDYYIKNVESGKFLSNGASWGTRSVLSDNGICYGVSKGADGKYTLKSGIKGDAKALRPSDGFNDQSGAWELIFEDDVVYMYNGSKYFCNDKSNLPQFTDTKNDAAKWQFISKAQLLENLDNASKSNPVDASFLITGADFHNADVKNSAWSQSKVGGDYGSGCTIVNSSNCEQWKGGNVDISQTITVPNGIYKLSVLGYTREDGLAPRSADVFEDNSYTRGYLYANSEEAELPSIFAHSSDVKTTGFSGLCTSTSGKAYNIPNNQGDAAVCFENDLYRSTVDVVVNDKTLKLGVKVNGVEWLVIDKFRLTYYGPASDEAALNSAKGDYNTALANAKAVDATAKMNAGVKTALTNAISTYDNLESTDPKAYNGAKTALESATTDATNSINAYAAVASKISVLDAAGLASFNASEVGQKYVNNTYLDEDINSALIAAIKAQTTPGANMTALIVNNSFENGLDGWQYTLSKDTQSAPNSNGTYTMTGCDGARLFNTWDDGQPVGQEIADLPAGTYTLTVTMATDAEHELYLEANGSKATAQSIDKGTGVVITLDDVTVADGKLKFAACTSDNFWYKADNFTLSLKSLGVSLDEYETSLAGAVTTAEQISGKMNAAVAKTLADAIAAGKKTYTTKDEYEKAIEAVNDAVDAANASIKNYEAAAPYTTKASGLDAAGQAIYAAAAKTLIDSYNNGTLVEMTADQKTALDAAFVEAIRSQTSENVSMTALIADAAVTNGAGWTDFRGNNGQQYEGAPDNQYMDEWSAGAHTRDIRQTITLKAGEYTLKAATRAAAGVETALYAKVGDNTFKTAGHADGNTDGELGGGWSWTTVDFSVAAESEVTIGFISTVNNSWAGADDFSLIRKGDYQEPAPDIAVTGISLDKTVAALNSANNSVTLTATIAPADATNKDVTWISSDENVAKVDKNGVVTGVASGKATITATSAADGEIKATATITTSYNETAVLPTSKIVEYEDGSKTIYTLSNVNLIKNGAFEYGNPFFGWTNAAGSAVTADKFDSIDGALVAKDSKGNTEAASIATKWEIEKNATYVFGYRTKANAAGNSEFHRVSLTNDGTESVIVSDNNQPVGTAWTDVQYVFENTDYGFLQFRGRWLGKGTSFDDFYLLKVTKVEEVAAPLPTTPELAIADGTAVTAEADKTYDMTYTRSFSKANSWQSLALPVEFVYNDEQVELAMFTGASVEDDGTTVINIAKVKVGDVIANNQPLLISAKTAGTKEIALGEATLYNAFEKGQAIDNEGNVVITNVLTAKKTGIAGKFVMSGGALKVVGDDSNKLGVNRWYMTINVPSGAEVRFRIEGFDGVEATGIASAIAESLGAKAYSINGAQVDASNAKGVYIQNGKKFIRK